MHVYGNAALPLAGPTYVESSKKPRALLIGAGQAVVNQPEEKVVLR